MDISLSFKVRNYQPHTKAFGLTPDKSGPHIAPSAPRILNDKMEECLKKAAEGRKFGVALSSLKYSGDLAKEMLGFSDKLEHVFTKMQEMRNQGIDDESRYEKYFAILAEKFAWYTKAEAGSCLT
jgi:hypothetical protein